MPPDDPTVVYTEAGAITEAEQAARVEAGTAAAEIADVEVFQDIEQRAIEQQYGDLGDKLITGVEGVTSSLTFGLSDLVADEDALIRAEVNPLTRGGAALATDIAVAVATGGTSLAARGATRLGARGLLSLTPRGALNRAVGRFVAGGGRELRERAVRGVVGGAVEGVADGAAAYISRQALSEDPQWSAEGLIASAGLGAVLGGGSGGAAEVGGRIADDLLAGFEGRLGREAAGVLDKPKRKPQWQEPIIGGGLGVRKPRRGVVSYQDVVSRELRDKAPEALGQLGKQIDDIAIDGMERQLADLFSDAAVTRAMGADSAVAAKAKAGELLARRSEAITNARQWFEEYAGAALPRGKSVAEVTVDDLGTISDDVARRGADALAELDDVQLKITRVRDDLAKLRPPVEPLAPSVAGGSGAPGRVAGVVEAAQNVAGAAEIAQSFGAPLPLPSVSQIPVIGELMSSYLKLKAGWRAAKGLGFLPAGRSTGAASRVHGAAQRVGDAVQAAVVRGARAAAQSSVKPILGAAMAQRIQTIMQADQTAVDLAAQEAADGAPLDVVAGASATAQRAVDYLQATAPKNPAAGTPWGKSWEPPETEAMDFSRRLSAVENPLAALERVLAGAPLNTLEAEAIKAVYPALWQRTQRELAANADRIVATMPMGEREALGRAFEVPLVSSQLPGYGLAVPPQDPGQRPAGIRTTAPRASTVSPLTTLDETGEQARARARR